MSPKVVDEPGFTVIRFAARTRNAKEMTSEAILPKQWARFMQEDLLARVPCSIRYGQHCSFCRATAIPDPKQHLAGSGNFVRRVKLAKATLRDPAIERRIAGLSGWPESQSIIAKLDAC